MKCRGGKMKANMDVDARKITMKKEKRKEQKRGSIFMFNDWLEPFSSFASFQFL